MAKVRYALSLRQPWATLVVCGLKSVEVRRWRTARTGRVLIHAARRPDERAEAWHLVPERLRHLAALVGGFIGSVELISCREYRTAAEFAAEQDLHLNDPSWFVPPVMFGFRFADPQRAPFRRYPGWMRFFPVGEALT